MTHVGACWSVPVAATIARRIDEDVASGASYTEPRHGSDRPELSHRALAVGNLARHESERIRASLAVTGGVHTALDVVKATMAGAHVTRMVSALLMRGPGHLRTVLDDLAVWMQEQKWDSLAEMRGNMSLFKVPDPDAYERANYMLMLQSWRG